MTTPTDLPPPSDWRVRYPEVATDLSEDAVSLLTPAALVQLVRAQVESFAQQGTHPSTDEVVPLLLDDGCPPDVAPPLAAIAASLALVATPPFYPLPTAVTIYRLARSIAQGSKGTEDDPAMLGGAPLSFTRGVRETVANIRHLSGEAQ